MEVESARPKGSEGNVWMVSAIILAAVIGNGVLPLAWAMAQLGWISGPLVMLFFFAVTVSTSFFISECYHQSHVEPTLGFQGAVRTYLGEIHVLMYRIVHGLNLFGLTIGDIIASSLSMMALMKFHCFDVNHGKDGCHMNINSFMIAIGFFQVFLSQIPAFDQLWQPFYVEPFLSFIYSTFLIALGIAKISETGELRGSLTGISIGTLSLFGKGKISRIFLAVGDIAFAYRDYSANTIFEVLQEKVESSPSELKKMKKAIMISSAFMTFLYMLCSCASYAAFGDHSTPRDLLADLGFGFSNLYNWLLVAANVALVIQCVGAYQVHSRALSDVIEDAVAKRFPTQITREIIIPSFRPYKLNLFRLVWRTIFALTTTLISMLLPFFNDVVGLIGALGFWPLTVYFPVQMYIEKNKIPKWSTKWILLQSMSVLCFIVSIAAAAGSIAGFVLDLETYKPFKKND
ncbi:amino acid permease 3-like [Juglans microcarpa x Juglans regia]|uniref:amino acid permease 3-like n=1 Tax=Juglans microcarpa x Juglans regia TaxID=2249226 RepID=UPI001B7F03EC|nr:amino acid permease 3-like [Juglans microcarpa x Juglans regia]